MIPSYDFKLYITLSHTVSHTGSRRTMDKIDNLRREIAKREVELADLRSQLAVAESEAREGKEAWKWPLDNHEYERYSRQMIVPNFGLQGMNPISISFLSLSC